MSFTAEVKCASCSSLLMPTRPRHHGRSALSPAAPLGACASQGACMGAVAK